MMNKIFEKQNNGFALLLTLIVVSVVLAVGLSLLDITLKQLVLSGTGRDSEIAFHAAYAGAECAQYERLHNQDSYLNELGTLSDGGAAPAMGWCLDNMAPDSSSYNLVDGANVHRHQYQITWGADSDRCSEIDLYLYDARALVAPAVLSYNIPYYGGVDDETCEAGKVCTILFSRGYNRGCDEISSIRTVQREVVLQY